MKAPIRIDELRVCGVKLHALQPDDALAIVRRWVESERSFHYVSSTNVNNVAIAIESPEYFRVIENADLSLVDGVPFLWYGRMKGFPLKKYESCWTLHPVPCRLRTCVPRFILIIREG